MLRFAFSTFALIGALALTPAASAQTPVFQPFGTGCMPPGGTQRDIPAIGLTGTPRVGMRFSITYTGPNHAVDFTQSGIQPFLAIGLMPQNLPIPQLFVNQPTGCTLCT